MQPTHFEPVGFEIVHIQTYHIEYVLHKSDYVNDMQRQYPLNKRELFLAIFIVEIQASDICYENLQSNIYDYILIITQINQTNLFQQVLKIRSYVILQHISIEIIYLFSSTGDSFHYRDTTTRDVLRFNVETWRSEILFPASVLVCSTRILF